MKKKLGLILFILPLLIGGVVVGLAMTRIINIPGLTPKKKKPADLAKKGDTKDAAGKDAAASDPAKDKPAADKPVSKGKDVATKAPAKPAAPDPFKDKDLEKGASKLAAVWAEMKPDDLAKIIPSYKDADLAPILKKMDEGAVAELLTKLKPDRAAALSRAIELSAADTKPKS